MIFIPTLPVLILLVSSQGNTPKTKKLLPEKNLSPEVESDLRKSDLGNGELIQQTPRDNINPSARDSGNEKSMQIELKKLKEIAQNDSLHPELNSPKNRSKASSRGDLKSDPQDLLVQNPENNGSSADNNTSSPQSVRSGQIKLKEERITNKKQPKKEAKEEKPKSEHTT